MRRERVPERVRRYVLLDPGAVDVLPQNLPRAHARERFTLRVQEEHAFAIALLEPWSQLTYVRRERRDRSPANRHQALLTSLPENAHEAVVEHDVTRANRDPLGHAQPRAVRELQHRAITKH